MARLKVRTGVDTWEHVSTPVEVRDLSGDNIESAINTVRFPNGSVHPQGSGIVDVYDLPSGSVGALASRNAGVQSIGNSWTKVTLDTSEWDSSSYFDNANDRMVVPAGHRGPHVIVANSFSVGSGCQIAIYKNGADWRRAQHDGTGGMFFGPVVALDPLAVPGDYYELWAINTGGAANVGHATVDSAESRLSIHKVGSGNVSGLDTARAVRTSGNITLNSTTWANVDTGLDIAVAAQAGDVLMVPLSATFGTENVYAYLDAATIVSGSPVNYVSGQGGATDDGVSGWWGGANQYSAVGTAIQYVVQAGDISGGVVTLRLRYRTETAANKTLYASADNPLQWSVVNLRGGSSYRGYPEGTVFPVGVASGTKFYRTDILGGTLFRYESSEWVTDQLFSMSTYMTASATNTQPMGQFPSGFTKVRPVRWVCGAYVATTNNGSHNWTLAVATWPDGGSGWTNRMDSVTSAEAADTYNQIEDTSGSDFAIPIGACALQVTKNGSPGTIVVGGQFYYRLIAA